MSDIVVTVPKGYFEGERYQKDTFTFSSTRKPKRLKPNDRIYIVYEGLIEEFYPFEGYESEPDDDYFEFYLGGRRRLFKAFPCKGFRGFRYAETFGLTRRRGRGRTVPRGER